MGQRKGITPAMMTIHDIEQLKKRIRIGDRIKLNREDCLSEDGRILIPGRTVVVTGIFEYLVTVDLPAGGTGYHRPWTMSYIEIAKMRRERRCLKNSEHLILRKN